MSYQIQNQRGNIRNQYQVSRQQYVFNNKYVQSKSGFRISPLVSLGVVLSAILILFVGSFFMYYDGLFSSTSVLVPGFGNDPGAIELGSDGVYHFKYLTTHLELIRQTGSVWEQFTSKAVEAWHAIFNPIKAIYSFFDKLIHGNLW